MPIPLIPAVIAGASGLTTGALLASEEQAQKKAAESRMRDRAVAKYYGDNVKDFYGPKGKELSNRNKDDEAGEAETLNSRAEYKADVADIANREAGLSAPSLRSSDQRRSMAKESALESKYGPSQATRDKMERSGMKKGGAVKKMAKGGAVKSSASSRGDGIAQRGKTRGKYC
jgi:hypothetical protein